MADKNNKAKSAPLNAPMAPAGVVTLTMVAETPVQVVFAVRSDDTGEVALAPHGLIDTPQVLTFLPTDPVIAAAVAASAVADKTNVYFAKAGAPNSGGAVPGTTVIGYLSAELLPSQIPSTIYGTPFVPGPPIG